MLSLAVTIAWDLWTRQNEKRNGKNFTTGFELVKWCGNYIESFKAATSANSATSTTSALVSARPHCRQVWSPPGAFVFKVNVDGAIFAQQRKSRVGVIIRVRTYVDHVKNICHLELANPLSKHSLLVFG